MCNYVVAYYDKYERIKFEFVCAESYSDAKNIFTVKNPNDDILGIYVKCEDIRNALYLAI